MNIADEILKQVPEGGVRYVHRAEEPGDYRVRFGRIRDELCFRISKTVSERISEVITSLRHDVISDPDCWRCYDTHPSN